MEAVGTCVCVSVGGGKRESKCASARQSTIWGNLEVTRSLQGTRAGQGIKCTTHGHSWALQLKTALAQVGHGSTPTAPQPC